MKVLIISDIHSNTQALSAVWEREKDADKVFCLGDVVNYGPNPKECLAFIRSISHKILKGNHDNAVAEGQDPCYCPAEYRKLAEAGKEYTRSVLDEAEKKFLENLPLVEDVKIDGFKIRLSHASPNGNFCKYIPPDTPDEVIAKELEGVEADFVFVGHTHLSMLKRVNNTVVVNPGSVGFPGGSNPMSSYAVLEDGKVEIKRIKYDVEATIAALKTTSLSPENIDALSKKLKEGQF